jgi:hypothetical protein
MDGVVPEHMLEESPQGDATAIAGGDAVAAVRFGVLEKGGDALGLEIDQPQATNRHGAVLREELKEKHHRIAICRDGMGARPAHFLQVVAQKRLDQAEEGVRGLHAGSSSR